MGELSGLGSLEANGVQSIIFEGSELNRGRRRVVALAFKLKLFLIHIVNFDELLFIGLVIVGDLDPEPARMHLDLEASVLNVVIVAFEGITFEPKLVIDRLFFRNGQEGVTVS